MNAYTRAARWLFAQLTEPEPIEGIGLAVYEANAPEGETTAESKFITFEALDPGSDVAEVSAHRIWTEYTFLVQAVTRGRSTQALEDIVDAIDDRLHRKSGVIDDARVLFCSRQEDAGSEIPESELRQGVEYRRLGGAYNLLIQPLNA